MGLISGENLDESPPETPAPAGEEVHSGIVDIIREEEKPEAPPVEETEEAPSEEGVEPPSEDDGLASLLNELAQYQETPRGGTVPQNQMSDAELNEWIKENIDNNPARVIRSVSAQAAYDLVSSMYNQEIVPLQRQAAKQTDLQREASTLQWIHKQHGDVDDGMLQKIASVVSSRKDLQGMPPEGRIALAYLAAKTGKSPQTVTKIAKAAKKEALKQVGQEQFQSLTQLPGRGSARTQDTHGLTSEEVRYAANYNMTPQEYAKWKRTK